MDHPSIVRIYETYQDKDSFYLVTEIVTGGELFDEIVNRNNFNEKDAATLMKQLFSVLAYCHAQKVVHRDIKPENILIESGKQIEELTIKVVDFGTAQVFDPNEKMT